MIADIGNATILISTVFYIAALFLPAFYTGNEFNSFKGITCLILGPLNIFGGNVGAIVSVALWMLNLPYFLCLQLIRAEKIPFQETLSILLVVGAVGAFLLAPWAKIVRDEAGNLDPLVLMHGGHLWLYSLILGGTGIILKHFDVQMPSWTKALGVLLFLLAGAVLLALAIKQFGDKFDRTLDARVEFSEAEVANALSAWEKGNMARKDLSAMLGDKCMDKGRYGLIPLSFFLLKHDEAGFTICLPFVREQSWIPDKYGSTGNFWRQAVIPSAMELVWGKEKTKTILETFLLPSITSEPDFYRNEQKYYPLNISHAPIRSENFRKYFAREQGPISFHYLETFDHLKDWQNDTFIENLIWLSDVSPDTFAQTYPYQQKENPFRITIAEYFLKDIEREDSPAIARLRSRLKSIVSRK